MSINFINEDEFVNVGEDSSPSPDTKFNTEHIPERMTVQQKHSLSVNCLTIANHIQVCPLCSQFYKNETRGHMATIVILIIIVILLLKKILKL